jgi:small subunit ribosomal protein S9
MSDATLTPPAPTPAVAPPAPARTMLWGTGRRKTAVARVRLTSGSGRFLVNQRELAQYFPLETLRLTATGPLRATNMLDKIDVIVTVRGGGPSGQAGAVSLGLARALVRYDTAHEPALRDGQFLTRDSRKVERKKYGQPGARRRFQFSKR